MDLVYRRLFLEGNRFFTQKGYVAIKLGRLIMLEHKLILLMAGYEIPLGYTVHHKDGNKLNNEISNLQILSDEAHKILHGLVKLPKVRKAQKVA